VRIKLKDIRPNPYRDMDIDPLNSKAINSLKLSIDQHGFWNGLQVRKSGKHYELIFGHHRLKAAIDAGIKTAEIPVVRMTDEETVRAMATENATHRETNFSACANDVAAACRVLGYLMLTAKSLDDLPPSVVKIFTTVHSDSKQSASFETCRGLFLKGKGLGKSLLFRYFEKRLPEGVINEVLAQMNASGKLAEITEEVVEKAIAAGADIEMPEIKQVKPQFDMAVGQIFTDTSHLAAFRKAVTSEFAKEVLPVNKQSRLASQIKNSIETDFRELPDKSGKKRPLPLTAEEIKRRTLITIGKAQGISRKRQKAALLKNEAMAARHEWSFARNKLSHVEGHLIKLEAFLDKGVMPEGLDHIALKHFFDNDLKRCNETFERIKARLSKPTKGQLRKIK